MTTQFRTRADLLAARAAELPRAERRAWSLPAAAEALGWSLAVLVPALLAGDDTTSAVGVWIALLVVTVLAVLRMALRLRALAGARAEARAWEDADRTAAARELDPGDIEDDLLTPFDARDREDFEAVRARSWVWRHQRLYSSRLLAFGVLAGAVPLILAVLGFAFLAGAGSARERVGDLVLGVFCLALLVGLGVPWSRELWRRQQAFNRLAQECQLWDARRRVLHGEPAAPAVAKAPLAARLLLGLLFLLVVAWLVYRVAHASALALVVVLVVLVGVAAAVAVPVLRRRSLHVYPLLSAPESLLGGRTKPVSATWAGEALRLTAEGDRLEVAASDVLDVVPVRLGYPFAPPAVGVVTRRDPLVLAGGDAPALRRHWQAQAPTTTA